MAIRIRKNYLINPAFQLKFITWALILAIASIAILYASNSYLIWKLWSIGETMGLKPEHPFFMFVTEQRRLTRTLLLISGGGISALIIVGGVLFSHRIAGPIRKAQNHLQRWAETGEDSEVVFRRSDFFPELADSINALHTSLKSPKE